MSSFSTVFWVSLYFTGKYEHNITPLLLSLFLILYGGQREVCISQLATNLSLHVHCIWIEWKYSIFNSDFQNIFIIFWRISNLLFASRNEIQDTLKIVYLVNCTRKYIYQVTLHAKIATSNSKTFIINDYYTLVFKF